MNLPDGIPLHETLWRLLTRISPDAFKIGFTAWVGTLVDRFEREVSVVTCKGAGDSWPFCAWPRAAPHYRPHRATSPPQYES